MGAALLSSNGAKAGESDTLGSESSFVTLGVLLKLSELQQPNAKGELSAACGWVRGECPATRATVQVPSRCFHVPRALCRPSTCSGGRGSEG